MDGFPELFGNLQKLAVMRHTHDKNVKESSQINFHAKSDQFLIVGNNEELW